MDELVGQSCSRYMEARGQQTAPDIFMLRYRHPLKTIVREIVRHRLKPATTLVAELAQRENVAAEHIDHFVRFALRELRALNDGNFAIYRLRQEEFMAWRAMNS